LPRRCLGRYFSARLSPRKKNPKKNAAPTFNNRLTPHPEKKQPCPHARPIEQQHPDRGNIALCQQISRFSTLAKF